MTDNTITIAEICDAARNPDTHEFSLGADGELQFRGAYMGNLIVNAIDRRDLLAIVERINDRATIIQRQLRAELEVAA
ncbi:MAG: hypothetical protein ACK5JT_13665 [Hyphomicrobiaceae bacterium]